MQNIQELLYDLQRTKDHREQEKLILQASQHIVNQFEDVKLRADFPELTKKGIQRHLQPGVNPKSNGGYPHNYWSAMLYQLDDEQTGYVLHNETKIRKIKFKELFITLTPDSKPMCYFIKGERFLEKMQNFDTSGGVYRVEHKTYLFDTDYDRMWELTHNELSYNMKKPIDQLLEIY